MTAVFERVERHVRPRVVQVAQRVAQGPGAVHHALQAAQQFGRDGFRQVGASQPAGHHLAQVGLRQLGAGGVDRGERIGQFAAGRVKGRVHHGSAHEATADFTTHPHPSAHRQRLLVRGVEAEEAQGAGVRAVVQRHQQLAARAHRDLLVSHRALHLYGLAVAGIAQAHHAGFVFVAQRQVQCQVDVAREPQLVQGFLRGRERLGGGGLGVGHGTILPVFLSTSFVFSTWNGPCPALKQHERFFPRSPGIHRRRFRFRAPRRTHRPAPRRRTQRLAPARRHGSPAGGPHLPRAAEPVAQRRPAGVQRHAGGQGPAVRREGQRRQVRDPDRARAAAARGAGRFGARGGGAHPREQEAAARRPAAPVGRPAGRRF
ncbi:hypothetical protein FQZ97_821750 [compost metagenome]